MRMELCETLSGHRDRVWVAKWSRDGNYLASASSDKTVKIYNNQFVCIATLEGIHQRTVRNVAWSPNGMLLACCSFDGTVSVWNTSDWECIANLEGHENEVKTLAWSSDGSLLATCGRDKSVWIWESENEGEFECLAVLHGHSQDVKSVLWHPTQRVLFSCGYDDLVKIWAEEDLEWYCVNTLSLHKSTVWSMDFDATGKHFVTVGDDLAMHFWENVTDNSSARECEKWSHTSSITGEHKRSIYSVAWSKNNLIATGSGDDSIRIFEPKTSDGYDTKNGTNSFVLAINQESAHEGDVNHVEWHPVKDNLLVSCGDDNLIKIWNLI